MTTWRTRWGTVESVLGKRKTDCCCKLSWREQRVSQPGKGHLWFLSPVWILVCLARWPEVVKERLHIWQECFFLDGREGWEEWVGEGNSESKGEFGGRRWVGAGMSGSLEASISCRLGRKSL